MAGTTNRQSRALPTWTVDEQGCVRHLQFSESLRVIMNSGTGQGVIFKPATT